MEELADDLCDLQAYVIDPRKLLFAGGDQCIDAAELFSQDLRGAFANVANAKTEQYPVEGSMLGTLNLLEERVG